MKSDVKLLQKWDFWINQRFFHIQHLMYNAQCFKSSTYKIEKNGAVSIFLIFYQFSNYERWLVWFCCWNDLTFESPFSAWSDPCWHASNIFLNGSSSLAVFEPLSLTTQEVLEKGHHSKVTTTDCEEGASYTTSYVQVKND